MTDKPIRVLVLTSSTGGGHDSRSRALKAWAARDASSIPWEVELHQALEGTHWLYSFGVELYNVIQRFWPRLHHVYYNVLEYISVAQSEESGVLGQEIFTKKVRDFAPDLVVSTHDHLNHGFFAAARAAMPEAPPKCVTYCTELHGGYGFSRHWVNPKADLFVGAVSEVCEQAEKLGMPPERVFCGGFLLNPVFWSQFEAEEEALPYEKLGLRRDCFTLLLATGANCAQNHLALLDAIVAGGKLPAAAQVVVLCGRNRRLLRVIKAWARRHPQLPVRPLPHMDHLAQLMRLASAVVARPGTGTTTEAILSGTPILFNTLGGIMPQEMITVKYCQEHGFGKVLQSPAELATVVRGWLADPASLAAERARVEACRPECTPVAIMERLRELHLGREYSLVENS